MTGKELKGLLKEITKLQSKKESLQEEMNGINVRLANVRQLLVEEFALMDLSSLNYNGHTIYRRIDRHVSVDKQKMEKAMTTLRRHKLGDLISVQPARYKSWVLEQLDQEGGGELPKWAEDFTVIHEVPTVRVRKA